MEQAGWGPQELRRKVTPGECPEFIDAAVGIYEGEPFFGP
jgi:hypothetical protein